MQYDLVKSGTTIRQLRMQNGYTQEGLAKVLNIDRSYLSYVEAGKKGCSVDLLVQFSALFNVSLDYLVLGLTRGDLSQQIATDQLKVDVEYLIAHLEAFKSSLYKPFRLCPSISNPCTPHAAFLLLSAVGGCRGDQEDNQAEERKTLRPVPVSVRQLASFAS